MYRVIGFVLLVAALLPPFAGALSAASTDLYGNEPQFANNLILTIDDCAIESQVRAMLDLLATYNLKATFFPNTRYMVQQDAQLWRDLVAAGHEIGYHTRLHTSWLTQDELTADFGLFQDEVRQILGDPNYAIRYVRPPNGAWNDEWQTWAANQGVLTVRWNFTAPAAEVPYIQAVLQNRAQGGSILLLHASKTDFEWLSANLKALVAMRGVDDTPITVNSLSNGLAD